MSSRWACTRPPQSSLRASEQVELPQVLRARVDERFQRAHAGSADAPLEITNLLELRWKRWIRVGFEPGLSHEQHPLGSYSKLGAESQKAHHVYNHLRRVARPQALEVKSHR